MKALQNFSSYIGSKLVDTNKGPSYSILMKQQDYQLRKYQPCIVAETIVQSTHQQAGSQAFRILAGYIFGNNQSKTKIQMTAPVAEFQVSPNNFAVQFFTPHEWKLQTLPKPLDSRVALKRLSEKTVFVKKYNGGWSEEDYLQELEKLKSKARQLNMRVKDQSKAIWARYNSPITLPPFRTNEIMLEVEAQN